MRESPRSTADHKDIIIGGCQVRLTFRRAPGTGWTVTATVTCGIGDHAGEQSVVSAAFDSREAAEHDALQRVTAMLGENTDRSRSRVRNWS